MTNRDQPSSQVGAFASVVADVITVSSDEFMVAVKDLKKATAMSEQAHESYDRVASELTNDTAGGFYKLMSEEHTLCQQFFGVDTLELENLVTSLANILTNTVELDEQLQVTRI
jgi:hypothetical protein